MNIANLLKYCPKGTKLYSTAFGEVELIDTSSLANTILVQDIYDTLYTFYSNGSYVLGGESILFPSINQRDWSKFRLPVKRGDIMMIPNTNHAFIATGAFTDNGSIMFVCGIDADNELFINPSNAGWTSDFYIPASEEAKEELFDKMAEAGYKWNTDTLELEKIEPKFKEGDIIELDNILYLTTGIIKNDTLQTCCLMMETTINVYEPEFNNGLLNIAILATKEKRNKFYSTLIRYGYKYDKEQHKLVKQELKPFEKVLVRNSDFEPWKIDFYSTYIENKSYHYICASNDYKICIPYEGNEYLLGTTDSPT